ncbi:MAG: helicase, partial [Propionibacteriaceae bacterium]|nr:helicase [Propionibacteriaceae bacterium]
MTRPPAAAQVLAHELAVEQTHVDRVYAALRSAVAAARQVEAESREKYLSDRADWHREEAGTALFERDAFAYQAARRLAFLDAEREGLVFGRLDLHPAETRYIGRLGLLDPNYEPLVIDWRAPAAESFYRATAVDPMGVVRRRVLRCEGERVLGIEDDLLDQRAAPADIAVIGEGAL